MTSSSEMSDVELVHDVGESSASGVATHLVELDERDLAVGVLAHEDAVDDRDGVVVDEPLQFGDDLTGELVAGKADDEDFDGAEGHGDLQVRGDEVHGGRS